MSLIQNLPVVRKNISGLFEQRKFYKFKIIKMKSLKKHIFEAACKFYKENFSRCYNEICKVQDLITVIVSV